MSEPTMARELVPPRYAGLPMIRLFLPLRDENDAVHRWSEFLADGVELTGSISWWEVWDRWVAGHGQASPELTPARGRLDPRTAGALCDALAPLVGPATSLTCHRWDGYGDDRAAHGAASIHRDGHTFFEFSSTVDEMLDAAGSRRLPEFGHDQDGHVAWGTNLYPDSLIIASEPSIYRALIADARVDTVTIRPASDVLPVSSGD